MIEPLNTVFYIITTGDEKADLEHLERLGFNHNYESTFSPKGYPYRVGLILYITNKIYHPEIMTTEDFDKRYGFDSVVYNIINVDEGASVVGFV